MDVLIIRTVLVMIFIWLMPIAVSANRLIELPPTGSDIRSFRCGGGIISEGDHPDDVIDKCGEPLDRGVMSHRKYDVWVYHAPGANFVHYLGFFDRRLQRIYMVSCVKKNPYCE